MNLKCNQSASKYVHFFGKNIDVFTSKKLNEMQIKKTLNEIIKYINNVALKKTYPSIEIAKNHINTIQMN